MTIYNRRPETFASDRYLLTNPYLMSATMASVVVSGELTTKHVYFRMAGTALLSGGAAGNRGFTAVENDLAMTGELFVDPNAATYARGQLFNDRMYTIKTLSVVTLPRDLRVGVIARYQDGQPFSRMVIVPGLNQGTEAVRGSRRDARDSRPVDASLCAPAEASGGGWRGAQRVPRHLQPAQHVERSGRATW